MRHFALACVLMCHLAAPAHAKDPPVDCANQITNHDMQICASADLDAADKALNAAYKKALATIKAREDVPPPFDNKAYEAALRSAQRAWVAFRDAECNTVIPFTWTHGTGGPIAVLGCLTTHTITRTKDLEETFSEQ